jgi:hypothetical protein
MFHASPLLFAGEEWKHDVAKCPFQQQKPQLPSIPALYRPDSLQRSYLGLREHRTVLQYQAEGTKERSFDLFNSTIFLLG